MLKSKAILIRGETKTYNGQVVRDLDVKVEKAIDEFVSTLPPDSIVDIKVNTEFTGVYGDNAFILILYKSEKTKQENDTNHHDDGKVIKYKK